MRQLTHINIYPVKSLDGFSPAEAVVEKRGLMHDRRWMLTDTEGVFQTQRTNGKMAFLRATIEDNTLIIKEKQNEANHIKMPIALESDEFSVTVWNDSVQARLVSSEADAFLSDFLGKKIHLVKMPEAAERRVEEDYNRSHDIVSFADGYPFLIIGEASMHDLNTRLGQDFDHINLRRFRANFIFSGGEPFEEDNFKSFKIGEVPFVGIKNCARCVLITRDPDTGEKGAEPLKTLQNYRQKGTKTLFGQNLVWGYEAWEWAWQPIVRVGDPLSI